jgi:hypothetical protein
VPPAANPAPTPQRDDEDMFEYLMAVRHACMDAFTGFFLAFGLPSEEDETTGKAIATKDPRRLAQQAAAARVLSPAVVPAFAEVVRLWAHEWAKDQAEATKAGEEWDGPDFVLLQKTVAAIGDVAKVVGRAAIGDFFTNRTDVVTYLFNMEGNMWKAASERDELDDGDTGEPNAVSAKKWLPA